MSYVKPRLRDTTRIVEVGRLNYELATSERVTKCIVVFVVFVVFS